ncbi:hypothetical protein C5E04_18850 [Pectobacterium parmentieri]|uniref:DUF551 domain-containing protein n=1 Tax=Pectobacterium parmentieri TaxID=1905730 RepID=UPI000EB16F57|nr:hypothetical protein C5E04_18850 [Pectobacterium parmentieri]
MGWIECSERLPDKNGGYLTWDGTHIRSTPFFFGGFHCWQPERITHWQPLPEPPQD